MDTFTTKDTSIIEGTTTVEGTSTAMGTAAVMEAFITAEGPSIIKESTIIIKDTEEPIEDASIVIAASIAA